VGERFLVERGNSSTWPTELIVLRDREAHSWLGLLPASGCNLVSFGARIDGRAVEIMLQPAGEVPSLAPNRYGAPVLFPFPNRLRNGQACFADRTIQIDREPGQANAIHGLVRRLPWQVEELTGKADAAIVRCSVEMTSPDLIHQFPSLSSSCASESGRRSGRRATHFPE
jgi:aldose 1-epimerase